MDYRNNYNKNDYNPNEMDSYDANDPNQYNPQQRPPPSASQSQYPPNYQQRPSLRKNDYLAKNYNDFMERQGIPALAPEDLEILNECGRESLYYRCVPITAALCAGLMYTARTKQIQPKFYHYLGAVMFGYFAGKISYRSKCEEKLLNSRSNSPFVNAIRKRKGMFVEEYAGTMPADTMMESDWSMPSSSSTGTNKSYGIQEFDNEELPFQQRQHQSRIGKDSNFDRYDSYGTTNDLAGHDEQQLPNTGMTYDELRNRNRNMFKNI